MTDATPHPRGILAATILGSSLAFIDGSVVNVALPALGADLHASASGLPWAINAYLLPVGALTLLGGGLGDAFGCRRLFQYGLVIFLLGSVLCGVAPSLELLLTGRALQGLGAALLMPNSLAILGIEFSGEARGRAIGTWAAVGALASALGPIVGGWLVDTAGWRVIFFLNLPLGVAAGYLAHRYVTDGPERTALALDFAGAALVTATLGLLTWALTEAAGVGHASPLCLATATAGAALLALFWAYESRLGDRALLPSSLFGSRMFLGLNLLTFFLYGSLSGLLVLLPYLLIDVEHWSATSAGAALLPVPVLIGLSSRFMGRLAGRYGVRLPLTVGASVVAAGLALYCRAESGLDYWRDVFPPTLLIAVGMSACVAPLTTGVMASVATGRSGLASGFNSAVARIAGLIATAMLGLVFAREASPQQFILAFHAAMWVGSAMAALSALLGLLLIPSQTAAPA